MKVTATSHAMTGNYQSLKQAHLEHDEEKYNSNKDIRYDKKHLNTHHVHVEDFDAFYEEKYEGPIKEYNAKQKRKDRKIDDYDTYLEQKKNNKNRNQKRPHDPNRLFLMSFSNMEDNDKIKSALMRKLGLTEDEYLKLMAGAMDLSVEKFNDKYGHCMTITEHFTHVNEASPHAHCDLYAHGTDKFGKPYTDINDSLKELYAGTKERDGKTVRKNLKDYWKDFRDEVDTMIIDSVQEKIQEKFKEKGSTQYLPLELYRKDSDYVGMSGEVYKEVHRGADEQLEAKGFALKQREWLVNNREQSLTEREQSVDDRLRALVGDERVLNEKEEDLDTRIDSFNNHVKMIYEDVDALTKNTGAHARVGAYVRKHDPKLYAHALNSEYEEHTARLNQLESKKVEKVVKGRNEPEKGKKGFDMEL